MIDGNQMPSNVILTELSESIGREYNVMMEVKCHINIEWPPFKSLITFYQELFIWFFEYTKGQASS